MKTNKIIIALGIALLISNSTIVRSLVSEDQFEEHVVKEPLTHRYNFNKVPVESSDDEILSAREFDGHSSEEAPYGWPKYKRSSKSFAEIENEYSKWASLDFEKAAADVHIPVEQQVALATSDAPLS